MRAEHCNRRRSLLQEHAVSGEPTEPPGRAGDAIRRRTPHTTDPEHRTLKFHTLAVLSAGALAIAGFSACTSNPSSSASSDPGSESEWVNPASSQPAAMSPAEAAERMTEMAATGPAHANLTARAGDWRVESRLRWGPDQPWETASGTIHAQSLLGGRFLMEEHELVMMGTPMQGLLFIGFDNSTKEYISLWMDSNSTWWVEARGRKGADGVTELSGTMKDFAGTRPYRIRTWTTADGAIENELYDTIGGREVLVMAYTSRREP
jgi:hypothetical protein